MSSNKADFESALKKRLSDARDEGEAAVTITSGELHRIVGGYPGHNHRMALCCDVMRTVLDEVGGEELEKPNKGNGASLIIKYYLDKDIPLCQ